MEKKEIINEFIKFFPHLNVEGNSLFENDTEVVYIRGRHNEICVKYDFVKKAILNESDFPCLYMEVYVSLEKYNDGSILCNDCDCYDLFFEEIESYKDKIVKSWLHYDEDYDVYISFEFKNIKIGTYDSDGQYGVSCEKKLDYSHAYSDECHVCDEIKNIKELDGRNFDEIIDWAQKMCNKF